MTGPTATSMAGSPGSAGSLAGSAGSFGGPLGGPVTGVAPSTGLAGIVAEVGGLTVVYDGGCALCQRCRHWVMTQPQIVPFRFVASAQPWVQRWLGGLVPVGDDLVVVDDWGRAWVGPEAFVVCLWGLNRYRSLAVRLQQAGGRLLAKHVFHSVSAGRGVASLFLRSPSGDLTVDPSVIDYPGAGQCRSGSCTT